MSQKLKPLQSSLKSGYVGLIGLLPASVAPRDSRAVCLCFSYPCTPCSVLWNGKSKGVFVSCSYPLISSVYTCKVGEHFAYVPKLPHYLFSKCSLVSDYLSLPPCFSRKGREKRMHHFLHFLPELLSLLSSFSLDSLNQRYIPKSVAHTHHSPQVKKVLFL